MSASVASTLLPRERVRDLLDGYPVDRTPIAEIAIPDRVIRELTGLPREQAVPWAARRAVIERLGHDLVTIEAPSVLEAADAAADFCFWVRQWRQETSLGVAVRTAGLLRRLIQIWGEGKARARLTNDPTQGAPLLAESILSMESIVQGAAAAGADLFVIDDPLADREGLRWSEAMLRQAYIPFLTLLGEIVHRSGLRFFLRAPGDLSLLFEDLVASGLDGLQGGCIGEGMSLEEMRRVAGPSFCLWGGIDVAWLALPGVDQWLVQQLRPWNTGPQGVPTILGTRDGLTDSLDLSAVQRLDQVWARVSGRPSRLETSVHNHRSRKT